MNKISPKKLLDTKWTAVAPIKKEKHFLVVDVEYDEEANVVSCIIEAVMTKRRYDIQWRELNDSSIWFIGWS